MADQSSNAIVNVDLGKFAEPLKTLIEKVSGGFNTIYEPRAILKRAEADAKAHLITTDAQNESERRKALALQMRDLDAIRHHANIESILFKAGRELNPDAPVESVSVDWVFNLLDKAKNTSDADVQSLWAKILAQELNTPGSFSQRTVNSLANFDRKDAELFRSLSRFCFTIEGTSYPVVLDQQIPFLESNNLSFENLSHLNFIGAIHFDGFSRIYLSEMPDRFTVMYFDQVGCFQFPIPLEKRFDIGLVRLTTLGKELLRLCPSQPLDGLWEYYLERYWNQFRINNS